ncbi:hypothetical protein PQ610_01585 [Tardisphaera miroshnichenkoae]
MSISLPLEIQVGDKKVIVDENVHAILREYVKTGMGIDELAEKLGFDNWSEAYELLKQVPAWLLWLPPSVVKSSVAQAAQQPKEETEGEKKEEKAEKKRRTTRKKTQKQEGGKQEDQKSEADDKGKQSQQQANMEEKPSEKPTQEQKA